MLIIGGASVPTMEQRAAGISNDWSSLPFRGKHFRGIVELNHIAYRYCMDSRVSCLDPTTIMYLGCSVLVISQWNEIEPLSDFTEYDTESRNDVWLGLR